MQRVELGGIVGNGKLLEDTKLFSFWLLHSSIFLLIDISRKHFRVPSCFELLTFLHLL